MELVKIPYRRRYPKCCTPAQGLNREAMQMGTDDTKGYSGGSDIVLYEVSTDVATEHATNLSVWVYGNLL